VIEHSLSRAMHWLTRCRVGWLTTPAIRLYIAHYGVDMREALDPDPRAYACFNAFFTRALKPGARPLAPDPGSVLSPVDGAVSACGVVESGTLLQAKGRRYRLGALLGQAEDLERRFDGGAYVTLYLAPRDYHRIHSPCDGVLQRMVYVPGRLFSVKPRNVDSVDALFARNERIICVFDSPAGAFAVIMIGAIFVGSMETAWAGEVTPARTRAPRDLSGAEYGSPAFARGAEIARFNMGSTVILLFEREMVGWRADLGTGCLVRIGEAIGTVRG
jgi:phosphatidylserine decarboxylase